MNVAHSVGTHAAKSGAGVHHARSKAGAALGPDAGTADQGFMALFNSLGDADAASMTGADKDALAALALHGVGGDTGGAAAGLPPSDPLALAAQAAQAAQAGGSAGAGAPAAANDTAAQVADASRVGAAGTGAAAKDGAGASAQDLALTGDAASDDSGAAAGVTTGPAAPAGGQAAHAQTKAEADLMKALKAQIQAADANGAAPATAGQPGAAQGVADGKAAAATGAAAAAGQPSEVQVADTKLAAQLRMADPSRQADAVAQSAPAAESLALLAASADGAMREAQRALEKSASRPGNAAADAGSPGQGFAVTQGAFIDKPSASVDVVSAQATPDVQVAEQVSYWVSRDVQNAELKLDGLGSKPVEVSISVVGQEAHVEFRTDQPEIRQVLENAMPHLKEMLQGEGMTLSGTTVGTSAQGGQASQEQRDRAEARQAKIALASLAPAQSARAVVSGLGGAVDYFV